MHQAHQEAAPTTTVLGTRMTQQEHTLPDPPRVFQAAPRAPASSCSTRAKDSANTSNWAVFSDKTVPDTNTSSGKEAGVGTEANGAASRGKRRHLELRQPRRV